MKRYIQKIRSRIGHDKFIHPAARILIENAQGEILIIERADNGQLGLPAGALEEGETIEACIKREVREETGLVIRELEVIGISTDPSRETVQYPNGDTIQYFTIEFYATRWEGTIAVRDKKEVKKASFAERRILEQLPENERSIMESLRYYRENKRIMLK